MTLWSRADIAKALGVSVRTVTERWSKRVDFPAPAINVSRKTMRWRADDVLSWAKAARQ